MLVIITKDGKPVDAFFHTSGSGVIIIEHDSPMAKLYSMKVGAKA